MLQLSLDMTQFRVLFFDIGLRFFDIAGEFFLLDFRFVFTQQPQQFLLFFLIAAILFGVVRVGFDFCNSLVSLPANLLKIACKKKLKLIYF